MCECTIGCTWGCECGRNLSPAHEGMCLQEQIFCVCGRFVSVYTIEATPVALSLTTLMCLIGGIQREYVLKIRQRSNAPLHRESKAKWINYFAQVNFSILYFRNEVARVKSLHVVLKILKTTISLAGATTMALYKGHKIVMKHHFVHIHVNKQLHKEWIRGSILVTTSCISWSVWFTMQVNTTKLIPVNLILCKCQISNI